MTDEQRIDFTDLLSQIDVLDELLDDDNERQQQTQVPAAGYAGDVDKDLRDILGDEFMDSFGPQSHDKREAPQAEPGTPAKESDAMSSDGDHSSCDSDEFHPFPHAEEMRKSAISGGTSCSMLVNRLNKNNAGMNDARAGAQVTHLWWAQSTCTSRTRLVRRNGRIALVQCPKGGRRCAGRRASQSAARVLRLR